MMEIKIKNFEVLKEVNVEWHEKLTELLCYVCDIMKVTITSGFRDQIKSVHGVLPLRGLDIRSRSLHEPQRVCNKINEVFSYDPKRPGKKCAILHDTGLGEHIHLQVHPKTVRILGGS